MNAHRAVLDMLDQRYHHRPGAALGWRSRVRLARIVAGIGKSPRPRASQFRATGVCAGSTVSCRHRSSASAIRFAGADRRRARPLAFGRIEGDPGAIEQAKPAQLSKQGGAAATGMTERNQPVRPVAQRQGQPR